MSHGKRTDPEVRRAVIAALAAGSSYKEVSIRYALSYHTVYGLAHREPLQQPALAPLAPDPLPEPSPLPEPLSEAPTAPRWLVQVELPADTGGHTILRLSSDSKDIGLWGPTQGSGSEPGSEVWLLSDLNTLRAIVASLGEALSGAESAEAQN
jgi:hypothetical protein